MSVNYEDKRFTDVEADKKEALSEVEETYGGMIDQTDSYYDKQIQASKDWAEEQKNLQNEQTDFAIEQIEQQKAQAEKDYKKEQSGAYVDWQKQSNEYGANAEAQAQMGMSNTGYRESSQVSMYNTYQNRVATAREAFVQAKLNYDNAIKDARLQNNAALAQIAAEAYQKQLELALQSFQYKNSLVIDLANQKRDIDNQYYGRWRDVLSQINQENALSEEVRQFNEQLKIEKEQLALQKAAKTGSKGVVSKRGASTAKGGASSTGGVANNSKIAKATLKGDEDGSGSKGTTALNKETAQSILDLGGPYSAKTVAEKVASGEVVETKDKNGNTVFKKKVAFPTAANNWGRG